MQMAGCGHLLQMILMATSTASLNTVGCQLLLTELTKQYQMSRTKFTIASKAWAISKKKKILPST